MSKERSCTCPLSFRRLPQLSQQSGLLHQRPGPGTVHHPLCHVVPRRLVVQELPRGKSQRPVWDKRQTPGKLWLTNVFLSLCFVILWSITLNYTFSGSYQLILWILQFEFCLKFVIKHAHFWQHNFGSSPSQMSWKPRSDCDTFSASSKTPNSFRSFRQKVWENVWNILRAWNSIIQEDTGHIHDLIKIHCYSILYTKLGYLISHLLTMKSSSLEIYF